MKHPTWLGACALAALTACGTTLGRETSDFDTPVNYDEGAVPEYALPDPLLLSNGEPVTDAATWRSLRRPEIMSLFEQHVYGVTPESTWDIRYEISSTDNAALNGIATRKEVIVRLTPSDSGPTMNLLLYLPNGATGPIPTFLGLNFYGNHSIHPDPDITISDRWMRENDDFGVVNNRATARSRGVRAYRWPVERILARGFGLATVYYGDIDPDFDDGFQNGIHPWLSDSDGTRSPEDWGSIAAWSWGLSRAMDYLESDGDVDAGRVIVMGHSRLGKTSLWAGARDPRFAIVISNNSGAGGAALSRRRKTLARKFQNDTAVRCGGWRRHGLSAASYRV